MTRVVRILLGDILEATELLNQYTAGLTLDAFADNIEKQDSVIRRIEVIGEGAASSRTNRLCLSAISRIRFISQS